MNQLPEMDGPHRLRQGDQERCAVAGHCIHGGYTCTVIAIRDRKRGGWVLFPHGMTGPGVLIADDVARTLATSLGRPS